MDKNIILIGFASCGKSAAAQVLCKATGLKCVDLDRVIENIYEKEYGEALSCREIFRSVGTQRFNELETEALLSLSESGPCILSTGGRTPMSEVNRDILKTLRKDGGIVYLKCGVETIRERMKNKGVPASMGNSPQEIGEEWKRRDPIYSNLADITIVNDTLNPNETASAILSKMPDFYKPDKKG